MRIEFNGEPREAADGISVAELLEQLKISPRHVAVELNLEVVPRERHGETVLREGDRLEVVTLVGGG
jgi:thiamine biosynthesis protein ThiS